MQPTPFPYTNLDGWVLYRFALPRKMEFGVCKAKLNFESSDIFRVIRNANRLSRWRISSQGRKDFVARQKNVGLQMFSTVSLKFGDSWDNFGRRKKEIVPTRNGLLLTDFFFSQNKQFCEVWTRPYGAHTAPVKLWTVPAKNSTSSLTVNFLNGHTP